MTDVWVGDPSVPWQVVLEAELSDPADEAALRSALAGLALEKGWPAPPRDAVRREPSPERAREQLAGAASGSYPVAVAITARGLALRGDHRVVDGLGMLALLTRLTGQDVAASARGVGARDSSSLMRVLGRRLREVLLRPTAVVAPSRTQSSRRVAGEVLVNTWVPGEPRTADLVVAGVRALERWNAGRGARLVRPSVAIGVSLEGGPGLEVRDRSGFLRLPDAGGLSVAQVREAMAAAPLQVGGAAPVPPALRRPVRLAVRMFSRRLGSTLLVSHLGLVRAPGVNGLAFFPVTGGASGLSLGAVTIGGRTTITLRARARQHTHEGLQQIVEALADELR